MSEWISVKDEAPQIRNGGCIVCDAHGFVSETHSLCMVTERKKGQYYLSDQYTGAIFRNMTGEKLRVDPCCYQNRVTHWMPLPEPPKEGE